MNQIEVMKRALDLIDSMEQNYGNLWHINLQPEGVDALSNDLRQVIEQAERKPEVHQGWVMVPIEPTNAMLDAADDWVNPHLCYKALLSAAPTAPAQPLIICECRDEASRKYCSNETRCSRIVSQGASL